MSQHVYRIACITAVHLIDNLKIQRQNEYNINTHLHVKFDKKNIYNLLKD